MLLDALCSASFAAPRDVVCDAFSVIDTAHNEYSLQNRRRKKKVDRSTSLASRALPSSSDWLQTRVTSRSCQLSLSAPSFEANKRNYQDSFSKLGCNCKGRLKSRDFHSAPR